MHTKPLTTARPSRRRRPFGTAVVELAVCLPIIVLLTLACIESCTMIYLKQSLTIAAYEAGRTAVMPGAGSSDVIADCQQVLADRNVHGAIITVNPTDITTVSKGSHLEVTITAPCDDNLVAGHWFFGGRSLTSKSVFIKEF